MQPLACSALAGEFQMGFGARIGSKLEACKGVVIEGFREHLLRQTGCVVRLDVVFVANVVVVVL